MSEYDPTARDLFVELAESNKSEPNEVSILLNPAPLQGKFLENDSVVTTKSEDQENAARIEESIRTTLERDVQSSPPLLNRRDFLKASGLAVAAVTAINKYPEAIDAAESLYRKEELKQSIEQMRSHLLERYGIEVQLGENPKINEKFSQGETPYLVKLEQALSLLTREIATYPPYMLRESNVNSISIVKELQSRKTPLWDRILYRGRAGGLQSADSGVTVAIGGSSAVELHSIAEVRKTFHHEVFHGLDDISDQYWIAQSGGSENDYKFGVDRGSAGKKLVQEGVLGENSGGGRSGFAREYGAADPGEDRATIFEEIVGSKEKVMERMKHDEVFRKKAMIIFGHLLQKSFGVMNYTYWDKFYAGTLNEQVVDSMIEECRNISYEDFKRTYAANISDLTEERFLEWQQKLNAVTNTQ